MRFPRPVLAPIAAGLAVSTFAAAWTFGLATAGLAADGQAARPVSAATARGAEWWLSKLKVSAAWTTSKGTGTTVAVLSDGVSPTQPDLAGSVTTGPDLVNGAPGNGPYFGQLGTGLASLIAGHGHGNGGTAGIMGVAPAAKILSVRVTLPANDPLLAQGSVAAELPGAIAAGIRYAVKHGADVIDLPIDPGQPGASGTGGAAAAAGGSAAERAAVRYALSRNVVLVAPAGDNGTSTDAQNFPAAYPGVIAVGAFDRGFVKAQWSSRQSYVSVTAAGTGLIAAANTGGYQTINSTSAASAVVAGIAALIRAKYPSLHVAQVRKALTSSTVFNNRSPGSGHGSVNAMRALTAAAYMLPAGPSAGTGAQPRTQQSPPRSARQSLPAILQRYGIISGGLLLVLLLLISARVVMSRRRANRKQRLVTEWAGRQAPSRYPHGGPAANPMLEFFASPVSPPAATTGSAQTGSARRKAASAQGLFAGVSRPATGAQAAGKSVVTRIGGARPAGALPAGPAVGAPPAGPAGGSPGSGAAPREPNRRPAVSGTPPWEPAPMPDSALPWAAAAAGRGLPEDRDAGQQAAGAGVNEPASAQLPAAGRAARLSRARHAPAGRSARAGQAVQMVQAAQHARKARQAEAGTSAQPVSPEHARQRGSGFRSVTGAAAWQAASVPQRTGQARTQLSGDELVETAWPAEHGTPGYLRQSPTGRLDWRDAPPAPATHDAPRQDPGGPLPVRQPRKVSQPGPLSPSGSLWERALESGERPAEGQDSANRPIYVWNPGANSETSQASPEQ